MKIPFRLIQTVFNIFLFALLPVVVLTLLTSKTGVLWGMRSFVVLSGSMEPVVPVGSIVFTVPSLNFNAGDIIAFQKGDMTVTHRITTVLAQDHQTVYQTRGDANTAMDSDLVKQKDIIGKMTVQFPYVGRVIGWLRSVPGFLIGVVIPGVIVIGAEILTIKKEMEKDIERKVRAELGG